MRLMHLHNLLSANRNQTGTGNGCARAPLLLQLRDKRTFFSFLSPPSLEMSYIKTAMQKSILRSELVGELVFKARRLVCHSTPDSRVTKKKKKKKELVVPESSSRRIRLGTGYGRAGAAVLLQLKSAARAHAAFFSELRVQGVRFINICI